MRVTAANGLTAAMVRMGLTVLVAMALLALACLSPASAQAAFPGENGRIAFNSDRDGRTEIYVMNPDGRQQTRLTCRGGLDPAWSANGERIAFRRGNAVISLMNADGSDQTPIDAFTLATEPAWSPDGERIAFTYPGGRAIPHTWIGVMNLQGEELGRFESESFRLRFPAWSPNGERIAFTDGLRLATANPDGSEQTTFDVDGVHPNWSPAGDRVVFADRDPNVRIVNADGTNAMKLADDGFSPAWSPDGDWIAFTRSGGSNLVRDIWIMRSDGAAQVKLAPGSSPDWQPLPAGSSLDPPPSQFCFEGLRRNVRRGIARLVVEVPRRGRLVLQRRPGVRRAVEIHDGDEGRVAVPVRARGKAQRRLNRRAKRTGRARVRVRAQVTYSPRVGEPRTKGRKVWLVKRR